MHVWLITIGEPLPFFGDSDVRLQRSGLIVERLVERKHEVTWWTSTFNHFNKSHYVDEASSLRINDYTKVNLMHGVAYKKNVSFARFINHWQLARHFSRMAPTEPKPDVVLCSFPPLELGVAAVNFGKRFGVPVILDVRDLWTQDLRFRMPGFLRPFSRFFLYPFLRSDRIAMTQAAGIMACSQRYQEWGLDLAKRPLGVLDRVFPHGYPTPKEMADEEARNSMMAVGVNPDKKIFLFIGTFCGGIDVGTILDVARKIGRRNRSDLQFVIGGDGERAKEWKTQSLGLGNVVFTGWVNSREIHYLNHVAIAGIGAYKKGAMMSITNKIFEYMSAGLPLLLSLPGEAARIIDEGQCGINYVPGDPDSLENAVLKIADNSELRVAMGRNSKALFNQRYNADTVYSSVCDFLESAPDLARANGL